MKTIIVTAGLIVEERKVLVAQRKEGSSHGLLWEFPGGKVEEGEEPRQALRRELKEELGIEVKVGKMFEALLHFYPEYPILLLAYHCRIEKGIPKPLGCRECRWVNLEELKGLAMAQADEPVQRHLCSLGEGNVMPHLNGVGATSVA
jgi:8-oxo-dGTP diphosphatase